MRTAGERFLYETRLVHGAGVCIQACPSLTGRLLPAFSRTKRALHAQIMLAIEHSYLPHRLGEQVDRLAHPCSPGRALDKSRPYFRQAGSSRRALRLRQAVAYFEQSLAALNICPRARTIRAGHRSSGDLRNSLLPLESTSESSTTFAKESSRRATSDQHRLGWISRLYLSTFGNGQP